MCERASKWCLLKRWIIESLFASVVGLLFVFASTEVILGLGEGVSLAGGLHPRASHLSSTLQVKVSVVDELASLGNVSLVVGSLLRVLLVTDLLVLGLRQTVGDVRSRGELSGLKL